MDKDWTGNHKSNFVTLGASNHTDHDRATNDFYATDPLAVELLLDLETFEHNILEPACGQGHISKVLENRGHSVLSTDLVYRGYGEKQSHDFLNRFDTFYNCMGDNFDIVTNPPFARAEDFVYRALEIVQDGRKVAMFLRLQFLEGLKRKELFEQYPPKYVYVASGRVKCALNGDFEKSKNSNAVCFCWFVWVKGFKGEPTIRWFN